MEKPPGLTAGWFVNIMVKKNIFKKMPSGLTAGRCKKNAIIQIK